MERTCSIRILIDWYVQWVLTKLTGSNIFLKRKGRLLHFFEPKNGCVKSLLFLFVSTAYFHQPLFLNIPTSLSPLNIHLIIITFLRLLFSFVSIIIRSQFYNPFRVNLTSIVEVVHTTLHNLMINYPLWIYYWENSSWMDS